MIAMRRRATQLAAAATLGALLAGCSGTPSAPPTLSADRLAAIQDDLDDAVAIVDAFWREQWPAHFTGAYASPAVAGLYDGTEDDGPTCDGNPLPDGNAFYCPEEDFLAWDVALLARGADIGRAWPYFVVAHEWGHAIEARIDPALVDEQNELQADCFAGATLAGALAEGTITDADLDGIAEALEVPPRQAGRSNHLDPAERLKTFDLGRRSGIAACLAPVGG